jgi:hypothetical protein
MMKVKKTAKERSYSLLNVLFNSLGKVESHLISKADHTEVIELFLIDLNLGVGWRGVIGVNKQGIHPL